MENEREEARIYVACLASYNGGRLHGRWISVSEGLNHMWQQVRAMLKASPATDAEEWAIHDYEGFEGIQLSEHEGFEQVVEIAEFIEKHGTLGAKVYQEFGSFEDTKTALNEFYVGASETVADFAEQTAVDTVEIPDSLRYYIDYEKMRRELEINDVLAIETSYRETHIFWRF